MDPAEELFSCSGGGGGGEGVDQCLSTLFLFSSFLNCLFVIQI